MKAKVTKWLQSGCSFADGLFLLPPNGIFANFLHVCKIQGATKSNVEMLEYQLCKAAGITEKEAKAIKAAKKTVQPPKNLTENVKTEQNNTEGAGKEQVKTLPENPDKTKLRDEFTFLNDPDCPNELKILVSDKISAYHNYCNAHERLFNSPTEGDIFSAASDCVENFLENRLIYEELNYYKEHKKLLMKHPVFELMKREKQIAKMKVAELVKLSKQLEMNIWRNKKLLEKEPGNIFTNDRLERLKRYDFEQKIVKRLLDTK